MITQKTFDFNIKENYGNDDFFVSNSNSLAHKVLLNTKTPEKYIYLKGPSKSGKTHIGQIWQKINNAILFNYNDYNIILDQKKNVFVDNFSLNKGKNCSPPEGTIFSVNKLYIWLLR